MTTEFYARRVALLARPGMARERLSSVLDESGALCVLEADPTELDPAALLQSGPQVVVVALDPLTEEFLEQFDAVLGDPSIDVIYEEAEQAVSREGWDAARWQRHLVAKLQGHANVLPPGRAPAEVVSDASKAAARAKMGEPAPADAFDPVNAEFEAGGARVLAGGYAQPVSQAGAQSPTVSEWELSLESIELDDPEQEQPAAEHLAPAASMPDPQDTAFADFDFSFELDPVADGGSDGDRRDDAGFGAFDPVTAETAHDSDLALDTVQPDEIAPRQELSLQDDEFEIAEQPRADSPRPVAGLHVSASTLELVDDTPRPAPQQPQGAVLILSGLGGPDAVRQLLGALPKGFARPVLVRQHLDGGRYDRLVTQLQRATSLPVALAEPAQRAMPGMVYILPDAVGTTSGEDGIHFSDNPDATAMAALPSADSAVLLLSGSDPAHVEAAMAHGSNGALVAGQAADGCYDPAASNALVARGGDVASPAALALRLSARWSNQGSSNVQV